MDREIHALALAAGDVKEESCNIADHRTPVREDISTFSPDWTHLMHPCAMVTNTPLKVGEWPDEGVLRDQHSCKPCGLC